MKIMAPQGEAKRHRNTSARRRFVTALQSTPVANHVKLTASRLHPLYPE
jgi:hypothetical protein